jgi:23S rRNA (uridine2552-2'-O)-methyltransferase
MSKSNSSQRWLKEHFSDEYVKKAQQEGYISRAAYKLKEMIERDRLFKPGMVVIDLGAAPGGWSLVASEAVAPKGRVIAVDCLAMGGLPGVDVIQGDFNDEEVWASVRALVKQYRDDEKVDVVLSDMAPNLSGNRSLDQPRSLHLIELAWDAASELLRPSGTFLVKMFEGYGVQELIAMWRQSFEVVKIRKPKASRARSREIYVLALGFKGII